VLRGIRSTLVALVVLGLLVVGCSPPADAGTGGAEATGSGCGVARRAGTRVHPLRSDGLRRSYRLTVPPGYTGDRRVPLVIDLHGARSNAFEEQLLTSADDEAAARGWIVATPDAVNEFWTYRAHDGRDVTFLRKVAQDVNRRLCIAPGRRFVMGMSNGGGMSATMVCAVPGMFAAFGAVGGLTVGPSCADADTPVLAVHGTADPIVPFGGGPLGGSAGGIRLPSVPDRLRAWSIGNHCTSGPTSTPVVDTVKRVTYSGCAARVELLRVNGGGHTWPGGPTLPAHLGPTSQAIDATEELFDFFQATFDHP
jgi:polyhydroxybutyrate depolymerase